MFVVTGALKKRQRDYPNHSRTTQMSCAAVRNGLMDGILRKAFVIDSVSRNTGLWLEEQ